MSSCERFWCDRPVVWFMTHPNGPTAGWCNKHTTRFPGYRHRVSVPAGSPQLTLEEACHV